MRTDVNLNSPYEVRKAALQAVLESLGPVGYARFVQMIEPGIGDYTKEKYEQPEIDEEEFLEELKKFRREA